MKTTIDIADGLMAEAKEVAQREKGTLRDLVEEGLRLALERRQRGAKTAQVKLHVVGGKGTKEVEAGELRWSEISDMLYGEEETDRLVGKSKSVGRAKKAGRR